MLARPASRPLWRAVQRSRASSSSQSATPLCAAMPKSPAKDPTQLDTCQSGADGNISLDADLMAHLERQSLVKFTSAQARMHLIKAIEYASRLRQLDVSGIEPMYTVFEQQPLRMRPDKPDTAVMCSELGQVPSALAHVDKKHTVDTYFVTPVGNIPLEDDTFSQLQDNESAIIDAKKHRRTRKKQ